MTKKTKNVTKRFKVLGVTCALSLLFSMPVMAAEKTDNVSVPEGNVVEGENIIFDDAKSPAEFLASVPTNDSTDETNATPRSIYGYAASYTNSTSGYFYVNATGSGTSTGGFTVESYSFPSSDVSIGITLTRPDGSVAKNTVLYGNQKIENLSFSNAPAGQYKVTYRINGSARGWIGAWVY